MKKVMPTKPLKTYENGWNDGYQTRENESVSYFNSTGKWNWGEWVTYNMATVISILVVLFVIWIAGIFIRWEAGTILQNPFPYSLTVNDGWLSNCNFNKDNNNLQCTFWKTFY